MANNINNIFIKNNIITHIDIITNESIQITQSNISKYYSDVFILMKKNNNILSPDIYNLEISNKSFEDMISNLMIYKVPIKILKNINHYNNIVMLSSEQLKHLNIFNYTLSDKNIVLPIFNIKFENIIKYFEQYYSSNTIENIYNILVLNQYFKNDLNLSKKYFNEMIINLNDSDYWTYDYNCKANITNQFLKRQFNCNPSRIVNPDAAKAISEMKINKLNNDENNVGIDYLNGINNNYKKYVDIASCLSKSSFPIYTMSKKTELVGDDIFNLLNILDEKQQALLFANLMASKNHCHLVINNEKVLIKMKPFFQKYLSLYKYLLGYVWIKFYFERCIKKKYAKPTDTFIFSINTAKELPMYNFDITKPQENPYMPILVSDKVLKSAQNFIGLPNNIEYTQICDNPICSLDEFRYRLNLFSTGNSNNNLFEGFDFKKYKVAISGSVMPACSLRTHPLLKIFESKDFDSNWLDYFDEYYGLSDIDVIFQAKDTCTFMDNVIIFYNKIVENICKFNNATKSQINLEPYKVAYLFVSEDFINKNITFDDLNIKNKVTYVKDNCQTHEIKNKFKSYYEELKLNNHINHKLNEKDYDFDDFIICIMNKSNIMISNIDKTDINPTKDIQLVYTYKYKITSIYLKRPLELFSIKYDEFLAIIESFYAPSVRSYYDGEDVYMEPECISALLTSMNIDFKYVSGSKDHFELINKERLRGRGTWLTPQEKKLNLSYIKNVPFWCNLYDSDNIYGNISVNDTLFKPRLKNISYYKETTNLIEYKYHYDSTNKTINETDLDSINIYNKFMIRIEDGQIRPLKKWLISAVIETYFDCL